MLGLLACIGLGESALTHIGRFSEDGNTRRGIETASAFRGKRASRHLGVIRHQCWGVLQM